MAVKHHHPKRGIPPFYSQCVVRWRWRLGLPFTSAWAAFTPNPAAVDTPVIVSFSEFEFNRCSNTLDGQVKPTNRSDKPILSPIRVVIKNIKPTLVSLASTAGLQPDGLPSVDVPLKNSLLSPNDYASAIKPPLTLNHTGHCPHKTIVHEGKVGCPSVAQTNDRSRLIPRLAKSKKYNTTPLNTTEKRIWIKII